MPSPRAREAADAPQTVSGEGPREEGLTIAGREQTRASLWYTSRWAQWWVWEGNTCDPCPSFCQYVPPMHNQGLDSSFRTALEPEERLSHARGWEVQGHLIMSQSIQPLPVVVNLGGDILILQDDSRHAALAPL